MKNPAGPGTRGAGTGAVVGIAGEGAAAAIPIATSVPDPGAALTGVADMPAEASCGSPSAGPLTAGPAGGSGAAIPGTGSAAAGTGSVPAETGSVPAGAGSAAAGTGSAVAGNPGTPGPSGLAGTGGTVDLAGPSAFPKTRGAGAGGAGGAQGGSAGVRFAVAGATAGACGSLTGHVAPDGGAVPSGRACLVTLPWFPASSPSMVGVKGGLAA
jgi:hypothetical protein